jgi:Lon protease-like protein
MSDELTRLFPLPNLVMFPGAMQPLHIFEPRYREMTADALAGDRRIALVLPKPGWEQDYTGTPAIHEVACVGRIEAEQRLADGRFNILLRGLSRIRIVEEVPRPKLYRVAQAVILAEPPSSGIAQEAAGRKRLREYTAEWFHAQAEIRDRFLELIDGDLGLGSLVDLVAFALPLDAEFKQTLLEELDGFARLERLLQEIGNSGLTFPPEFSSN